MLPVAEVVEVEALVAETLDALTMHELVEVLAADRGAGRAGEHKGGGLLADVLGKVVGQPIATIREDGDRLHAGT